MTERRQKADAEREAAARRMFPYEKMSPARFAALEWPNIASSSFDEYAYEDVALDAWIQEMHAILRDSTKLAEAMRQHLTPEERRQVEQRAKEPF